MLNLDLHLPPQARQGNAKVAVALLQLCFSPVQALHLSFSWVWVWSSLETDYTVPRRHLEEGVMVSTAKVQ